MAWDAVVLGGGAAGLMCGLVAAGRGRRVLVLEHNAVPGEKIRISGGGRCNFTNIHAGPANYRSENPRFCTSALARYTPADFIALVDRHGIAHHEKKLGQLFCDGPSTQITRMLVDELTGAGGELRVACRVDRVARLDDGFRVETSNGPLEARAVVVATGGLSIPKLGATGVAHRIASDFGLRVVPPRPGLVPLTWGPQDAGHFGDLSGLSADCVAEAGGVAFREHLLFTHRGLSGPAILQASSYWDERAPLHIDLAPGHDVGAWLIAEKRRGNRAEVRTALGQVLPARLAERWCALHRVGGPLPQARDADLSALGARLQRWKIRPGGTEGFKKAEVTTGGVDTRALHPKTMEARAVPGLHFIGEAVDVTGWLGGYNFQWAWASGHAAGTAI